MDTDKKKGIIKLFLILSFISIITFAATPKQFNVIFIGESTTLSGGWVGNVSVNISSFGTVFNKGVSGNNFSQIYDRLATDVYPNINNSRRNIIVVWAGANDFITYNEDWNQAYTQIARIANNISKTNKSYELWFATAKPAGGLGYILYNESGFNNITKGNVTPLNISRVIDLYDIFVNHTTGWTINITLDSGDYVHPNALGYNQVNITYSSLLTNYYANLTAMFTNQSYYTNTQCYIMNPFNTVTDSIAGFGRINISGVNGASQCPYAYILDTTNEVLLNYEVVDSNNTYCGLDIQSFTNGSTSSYTVCVSINNNTPTLYYAKNLTKVTNTTKLTKENQTQNVTFSISGFGGLLTQTQILGNYSLGQYCYLDFASNQSGYSGIGCNLPKPSTNETASTNGYLRCSAPCGSSATIETFGAPQTNDCITLRARLNTSASGGMYFGFLSGNNQVFLWSQTSFWVYYVTKVGVGKTGNLIASDSNFHNYIIRWCNTNVSFIQDGVLLFNTTNTSVIPTVALPLIWYRDTSDTYTDYMHVYHENNTYIQTTPILTQNTTLTFLNSLNANKTALGTLSPGTNVTIGENPTYTYESQSYESAARGNKKSFGFFSLISDSYSYTASSETASATEHTLNLTNGQAIYRFDAPTSYNFTNIFAGVYTTAGITNISYSINNVAYTQLASSTNDANGTATINSNVVYIKINSSGARIGWIYFNSTLSNTSIQDVINLPNTTNTATFTTTTGNASAFIGYRLYYYNPTLPPQYATFEPSSLGKNIDYNHNLSFLYNFSVYGNTSNFTFGITQTTHTFASINTTTLTNFNGTQTINITWYADSLETNNRTLYIWANTTDILYNNTVGTLISNLQDFNASTVSPPNASILYSANTNFSVYIYTFINVTCTLYIDGLEISSGTRDTNGLISINNENIIGNHTYYFSCTDIINSKNTETNTFTVSENTYIYLINLTSSVQTYDQTQPNWLFYDIFSNLWVAYFINDSGNNILNMRMLYMNNQTTGYNVSLEFIDSRIVNYVAQVYEQNYTGEGETVRYAEFVIVSDLGNAIRIQLKAPTPNNFVLSEKAQSQLNVTNETNNANLGTALANGMGITSTIGGGALFMTNNGTNYTYYWDSGQSIIHMYNPIPIESGAFNLSWQTIPNNNSNTLWYFISPVAYNCSANYRLVYSSFNGSTITRIANITDCLTPTIITATNVYMDHYQTTNYAILSNSTQTIIFRADIDNTLQLNNSLSQPSPLLFIDEETFVIIDSNSAYIVYFSQTIQNYTKISQANYGFTLNYLRGLMSASARNEKVTEYIYGSVQNSDVIKLIYNYYSFDSPILCYDEVTEARKPFTMNIFTDNTGNQLENASFGYKFYSSGLGTGTRMFYTTCQNGTQRLYINGLTSNMTIDAYSLNTWQGAYYTLRVLSQFNTPIPNATISIYRFSISKQAWVVVEQGLTDYDGYTTVFLQPYTTYKLVATAPGFTGINYQYTPGAITSVQINLATSTTSGVIINRYETMLDSIAMNLTPATYFNENLTNITLSIFSNNSQLEYYGMNITRYYNGTTTSVYNTTIAGSPSGGIISYLPNATGIYTVSPFFKTQNFSAYIPPGPTYYFQNATGISQASFSGFSGWGFYFVMLMIAVMVGAWGAQFSIEVGGVIGLVVLWIGSLMNPGACLVMLGGAAFCITPIYATALTTLVVGAGVVIKNVY